MAGAAELARVLHERAAEDELIARSLLPVEGVTDAGLGFHVQQTVEKSLKAVLALNGVDFPYSHDLNGLLRLCSKNAIEVPDELAGVGVLSVFGVRLRYDASPAAASLDRSQGLVWATAAVAWAGACIEAEGRLESQGEATPDASGAAEGTV